MKNLFCTMIAVISILALHISLCFAGDVPSDIKNAADEGIRIFLKDPRMTGLQRLGFESQPDIENATIDMGLQVFIVALDKLFNESDAQNLELVATPTNQWEFLVVAGKKPNALLTVDLVEGKWTPVGIGSSGLAKKLSKLLETWPVSSGYEYRLISAYQVNAKFVEVSQGEIVIGLVPLTYANAAMGELKKEFDPTDILTADEVLTNLRSIVLKNIRSGQ